MAQNRIMESRTGRTLQSESSLLDIDIYPSTDMYLCVFFPSPVVDCPRVTSFPWDLILSRANLLDYHAIGSKSHFISFRFLVILFIPYYICLLFIYFSFLDSSLWVYFNMSSFDANLLLTG
jgi:hypothetical protein